MLAIKSELVTKTLPEKGKFELVEPLFWFHPLVGEQTIPKGFVTDFASIPKFFRRLFSVNGVHREEAVVHDYLYSSHQKKVYEIGEYFLTRKECDDIFKSGLKKENLPYWKIWSMYTAVRVFGGLHNKLNSKK